MDTTVDTGMDTALWCQCMHILDGEAANGATGTTRNRKPGAVAGWVGLMWRWGVLEILASCVSCGRFSFGAAAT